jgi:hypothetical protein
MRKLAVRFMALLDDRSEHPFQIDTVALCDGATPFAVALEAQRAGLIPPGDIIMVRRACSDE